MGSNNIGLGSGGKNSRGWYEVDGFTDISEYPNAETIPGLLVYRFDAALLFFNSDL
jgi:hypothetical protein